MKKLLPLILLLVISIAVLVFSIDDKGQDDKPRSSTISTSHFNTYSAVYTYGDEDDTRIGKYRDIADEALGYYHKLFDIYYDYSGVTGIRQINQKAGREPVKVDSELIDFFLYCKELFTLTNGKTNVMIGAVLKIWHNHREDADYDPSTASVPSMAELEEAAQHTSIDSLVIDKEAGTVYISDPKASLDVGAIGKGYATEKLYEKLVSMGADHVALNIGGNIRTIGLKPDGTKWLTGLTNPDKTSSNYAAKLNLGETACVTSGNYERYYVVDGVNYHHIIDPDTLMPSAYFSSVTIITENSGLADALSTALFCMSYEEGRALVESLTVPVGVIWIDTDYKLFATEDVEFVNN